MSIDGGAILVYLMTPGHLETTDFEEAFLARDHSNVTIHQGENLKTGLALS